MNSFPAKIKQVNEVPYKTNIIFKCEHLRDCVHVSLYSLSRLCHNEKLSDYHRKIVATVYSKYTDFFLLILSLNWLISKVTRASRTAGSKLISSTISLLSWQRVSFWSSQSTLGTNFAQIFRIFCSSRIIVWTVPTLTLNCALIVSIDARRFLSMKIFIWPINSVVLTSLLLPHFSSSLTDSLPSWNLLCHSKTDARFMQDGPKADWSIPYVSVAFFFKVKTEFYCILFF